MTQADTSNDVLRVGRATFLPGGTINFRKYKTGETAIEVVVSDEPGDAYLATVALVGYGEPHPGQNCVWLKGWSENEGVPEALEAADIVKLTGRTHRIAYVTAQHAMLTERACRVRDRILGPPSLPKKTS